MQEIQDAQIKSPSHYAAGRKFEPISVIQDWELNFSLGNVVKYIARAGRKDGESDLKDLYKAKQYLEFEIMDRESKRLKNGE